MAENLMQIAGDLKMLPDDQLQLLMQSPNSPAPQFLVLGEIQGREKTRAAAAAQQQQQPTTVAQDAMAQGGQQMISRGNIPNQMQGFADGGAVEDNSAGTAGGIGGGVGSSIQKDYGLEGAKSLSTLNRGGVQGAVGATQAGSGNMGFWDLVRHKNNGYSDGGAVTQDIDGLNRSSAEIDYGIPGNNSQSPAAAAPTATANPMANYSQVIQDMAKAQAGPHSFGNGGFMGRLKAMTGDPEGYRSFIQNGGVEGSKKKKSNTFGLNDGGAVRPRFSPGFADGGAVGGLMPLSRDPATGKVRFGG
jgi:hypothetical protein